MEQITYRPIGIIHSPRTTPEGTPIQPAAAADIIGTVEIDAAYRGGLVDLEGFSHIILLYHNHLVADFSLRVTPFLDDAPRGVFATRAPRRPNAIGLSIVELISVDADTGKLEVRGLDALDGTPLLDIKPYVPAFDAPSATRIGWLAGRVGGLFDARDDGRFRT